MPLPGSKTWRISVLSALCLSALVPAQPGCVHGVVSGPIEKPPVGATVTVIEANDRSLTNTAGWYCLFESTVIRYDAETPVTEFGAKSRENWISLQNRRFRGGGPPHQISGPTPPGQARGHHFSVNLFQDMMLDALYTIVAKCKPTGSARLGADPIQVAVFYSGGGIY